MWLDVEEEQEFAWLMSEVFALVPQPLSGVETVLWEEKSDTDSWGYGGIHLRPVNVQAKEKGQVERREHCSSSQQAWTECIKSSWIGIAIREFRLELFGINDSHQESTTTA